MSKLAKGIKRNQDIMFIYIILTVMIVILIFTQKNFLSLGNLGVLAKQLSPLVFAGMAQMLIMLLGGMDFSVGAMISLATCIMATRMSEENSLFVNILVILMTLVICAALSGCTGLVVSKFKLPAVIVTLATSYIWEGLALVFLPVPGGYFPHDIAEAFISTRFIIPIPVIITAAVILIWSFVRKSSLGRMIYAVGNNMDGAYSSGLSVIKIHFITYAMSGFLSGLSGLMLCAMTTSGDPTIGSEYTMYAVTAAVLGGVSFGGGSGKVAGTVAGAIFVGMLVNVMFFLKITGFASYIVQGVVLVLAVAVNYIRELRSFSRGELQ